VRDESAAHAVPARVVNYFTDGVGEVRRRQSIHGHFGDRKLSVQRLATRFEIDIFSEAAHFDRALSGCLDA
jgi:hypothetical protein